MPDDRRPANSPHLVMAVVAAVALLLAVAPWPYGYFVSLRWIVCIAAVWIAWRTYSTAGSMTGWTWLFGAIAILFNPVAPIHMSREVWLPVDIATAIAFVIASVFRVGSVQSSHD